MTKGELLVLLKDMPDDAEIAVQDESFGMFVEVITAKLVQAKATRTAWGTEYRELKTNVPPAINNERPCLVILIET
jgi:hypothetical protein